MTPPVGQIVEVLLVEDSPSDAELCMRSLRKHNLANAVHLVRDGAGALDFLFGTGPYAGRDTGAVPKLVLLDLKLPKVDGLEVLRQLKSNPVTRNIPIVVLTSSQEDQDLIESYRLGVNSYIVKPVDFAQFTESVRQLGLYWLLLNKTPS